MGFQKWELFRLGKFSQAVVSELILHDTRLCDEEAVHVSCHPRDVACILSIKLSARATEDFIAWSGESNDLFSVRSAYRLGTLNVQEVYQGQASTEPIGDRRIWDTIWKMDVPHKVRIFAWRAATNSLPVKDSLHRRIHKLTLFAPYVGWRMKTSIML
jgi:hypothetical protein